LNPTGSTITGGSSYYTEDSYEVWQSSAATGTREYAVLSGDYEAAIGAMVLVGEYAAPSTGGWGVGMIRMGAN
jgi:hypothetical protein